MKEIYILGGEISLTLQLVNLMIQNDQRPASAERPGYVNGYSQTFY